MADGGPNPDVFAGADAGTAREAGPAADVEIDASFSASRLKHLDRPRSQARVESGDEDKAIDETVRENLPSRVTPGRVYENVRGRRTLGVRLGRERADGD